MRDWLMACICIVLGLIPTDPDQFTRHSVIHTLAIASHVVSRCKTDRSEAVEAKVIITN